MCLRDPACSPRCAARHRRAGSSYDPLPSVASAVKNFGSGSITGDGVASNLVGSTSALTSADVSAAGGCLMTSFVFRAVVRSVSAVSNPTTAIAAAMPTIAHGVNRCQCESGRALRASISFGKKLQSRVAPSYYLESLLCNAPTEAFSNKRSRSEGACTCAGAFHATFSERAVAGQGCHRAASCARAICTRPKARRLTRREARVAPRSAASPVATDEIPERGSDRRRASVGHFWHTSETQGVLSTVTGSRSVLPCFWTLWSLIFLRKSCQYLG